MNLKFNLTVLSLALAAHGTVLCYGDGSANTASLITRNVGSSYHVDSWEVTQANHQRRATKSDSTSVAAAARDEEPDTGLLASAVPRNPLFPRHRRRRLHGKTNNNNNDNDLRFLQSSGGLNATCPHTCDPDLCACVAEHGEAYPCAAELHAVCEITASNNSTDGNVTAAVGIEGCVPPSYVYYYENVYCPFAACLVGGISYQQCSCEFYQDFCAIYGENPEYGEEEKTVVYCAIAACCQKEGDDDGKMRCLLEAKSLAPSGMPSGPTVSPTKKPTTAPTEKQLVEKPSTKPVGVPSNNSEGGVSCCFCFFFTL